MQISKLKVFSHDVHATYEKELEALGALKQLKYFYNLPIGQLFTSIEALYAPTPVSDWWKAATTSIASCPWASWRVCDFLKEVAIEGKKNENFNTEGATNVNPKSF